MCVHIALTQMSHICTAAFFKSLYRQMRGRGRGWGRGRGHNRGRGRGRGYSAFHPGHPRVAHQSNSSSETYPYLKQHCRDGDPLGALASCDQGQLFIYV